MLRVTVENLSDVTILHCAGRICAGQEAATLRRTVERQVAPRTIIIDLAEVSGVDAAGLGTLVAVRKWVLGGGKELKLMNVTPHFETVLSLTHLASIFEICSVAEMVELLCRAATESSPCHHRGTVERRSHWEMTRRDVLTESKCVESGQ